MRINKLIILCLLVFSLTGCACKHQWSNATCITPKTCSECGATEGSFLGHQWSDATCTAPKTCINCSKTEGDILPHQWSNATCLSPAVCSLCSLEGELGNHLWVDATYEHAKYCSTCKVEDGLPLLDSNDSRYTLAACAYYIILEKAYIPSSVKIERARYSPELDDLPYPVVVLECSAENSLGGRTLIHCYAYKVTDVEKAKNELPPVTYYTFTHNPSNANMYTIFCRAGDAESIDDVSTFGWEELNHDLILKRYEIAY